MKEKKKELYRQLLYWAMIDMRMHSASGISILRSLLSRHRRTHYTINRFTYAMNNWLHNTALYSTSNFVGFKEELFWEDYRRFRQEFPADRWAGLTESIIKELQATVD
ncbi:MAG: hypothetical protein ACRYF0_06855 [Janthinobacterium lividum]